MEGAEESETKEELGGGEGQREDYTRILCVGRVIIRFNQQDGSTLVKEAACASLNEQNADSRLLEIVGQN